MRSIRADKISNAIWLIPIVMALMTLGMNTHTHETDLGGQIYNLESIQYYNLWSVISFSEDSAYGLYYFFYILFHKALGCNPLQYISIITFTYYVLVILILKWYFNYTKAFSFSKEKENIMALYTIAAFSPTFICISRFLFAVNIVLIGFLFIVHKKIILGSVIALLAINAHEGMKLILAIILLSVVVKIFWLQRIKKIGKRNFLIIIISILLLIVGPYLFSFAGDFMSSNNMLSEKYQERYIEGVESGDGLYKYVLILAMSGTFFVLLFDCLKDESNDWLNSLCISSFFMICLFLNHKVFYAQRIFMFMPVFMGLSSIRIFEKKKLTVFSIDSLSIALFFMASVYLSHFYFYRKYLFDWEL